MWLELKDLSSDMEKREDLPRGVYSFSIRALTPDTKYSLKILNEDPFFTLFSSYVSCFIEDQDHLSI